MAVSTQLGMGAMPFGGGTGFRVWTPFAMSVAVCRHVQWMEPRQRPSNVRRQWLLVYRHIERENRRSVQVRSHEPLSCRSFLEERPLCPVNDQLSWQRHYRRSELCLSECRIFHACLERNR